jgi:CheY-like chemotaxis protein
MLAVIIGNLNMIQRRMAKGRTDVGAFVDSAMEGANRAATLTSRLLAFSRQQPLAPEPIDPNRLVIGMSDLLARTLGETIIVETVLGAGIWRTESDAAQLESALVNLAVNGRDAMAEGGRLTIETVNSHLDADYAHEAGTRPGQYVMIAVTDSGVGMTSEVAEKAIEPFFTTKPVGSGTGLGLSQVYGFARQSGGVARIRSAEGEGTTVEMLFPEADGESEELTVVRQAPAIPALAGACHILVVEDDPDVRRVIVECLSLIGYKVTEAANGNEALTQLAAAKPDLLVVDYAMPDMTGAEVISEARKIVGDVPVILATGYADMAAVERLAGRPKILRKPFDIAQLGDAVSSVLEAAKDKALVA